MRIKKGTVTSAKMKGTVVVATSRLVMHPMYRKRYPVSKKFLVDVNGKDVKEGDVVIIGETRPLSKRKRFKVVEVVGREEVGISLEDEISGMSVKKDAAAGAQSDVTLTQQ